MTGAVLAAIYIVALSFFLGLDIIKKVPATLYGLVLAGLGALAAVSLVGSLSLLGPGVSGAPAVAARLGLGMAVAAAVGGTLALGRMMGAFAKKKGAGHAAAARKDGAAT
jgi:NAD(P) transhydrogenase subunit alpha